MFSSIPPFCYYPIRVENQLVIICPYTLIGIGHHCQAYVLYTIVLYSHIVVNILLLNLLKCISKPCIIKGCTAGMHTCMLISIKHIITFDTVSFEKLYDLTVFLATFWDEIVRRSAPKRWRVNLRRSAPKRWRVKAVQLQSVCRATGDKSVLHSLYLLKYR